MDTSYASEETFDKTTPIMVVSPILLHQIAEYVMNRFICALFLIASTAQGYFTLITTLYNETNKERADEYITCLQRNLAPSAD